MLLTPNETLLLIVLARNIEWRLRLDSYEASALKVLLRSVKQSERDVLDRITSYGLTVPVWEEVRTLNLLDEFSSLTGELRSVVGKNIAEMVSHAGVASLLVHNDIVSFGNRITTFQPVSASTEQLRSVFTDVPVGGYLLSDRVDNLYDNIAGNIREDLSTGSLQGADYHGFVRDLTTGFREAEKDAATLAQTYVQSANTLAQEVVYRQNGDIVKGVRWTAILEAGYKRTGRGTCLRCAVLDGIVFALGTNPPCPLHDNCRCSLLPEFAPASSLGLNMTEISNEYSEYINTKTTPGISGNYESWFKAQSESTQQNLVGPNRYALIKTGRISFSDLIDRDTGRLRTLSELGG